MDKRGESREVRLCALSGHPGAGLRAAGGVRQAVRGPGLRAGGGALGAAQAGLHAGARH